MNIRNVLVLLSLWGFSCFGEDFTLELENDMLYRSDEKYTHGTRITYGDYSIGQNMYTPSDLEIDSPTTNERAYAGILYFSVNQNKTYDLKFDTFHQLEVAVGFVGQSSLAKETQTMVHEWTDSDKPMGWDYQVDDSFLLQLNGRVCTDLYTSKYFNSRLYSSLELGTVFGNIGGGANLIAGYNIPKILNKPIMSKHMDFSVYVFGDVLQRYICWNNLLNSDYTDVHKVDNVTDLRYGIGVSYKVLELRYSRCDRTKEFDEQNNDASFGSVFIKVSL